MLSVVLLSLILSVSSQTYYSYFRDSTCSGSVAELRRAKSGVCFSIAGQWTSFEVSGNQVEVSFFELEDCKGANGSVTVQSGSCIQGSGSFVGSLRISGGAKLLGALPGGLFPGSSGSHPAPAPAAAAKKANKKPKRAGGARHTTTTCVPTAGAPKGRATKPPVVPMPSLFPKPGPGNTPGSGGGHSGGGSCGHGCAKKKAAKAAKRKAAAAKKQAGGGGGGGISPGGGGVLFPKP